MGGQKFLVFVPIVQPAWSEKDSLLFSRESKAGQMSEAGAHKSGPGNGLKVGTSGKGHSGHKKRPSHPGEEKTQRKEY